MLRIRSRRGALIVGVVALLGSLLPAAVAATTPPWTLQRATYGEGSELNLPVTASDGTVLRADVYFPTDARTGKEATGHFPVLLQQTPYGKESIAAGGALAGTDIGFLVQRGFIVVVSDVRGTGDSGGTWGLFDPVQAKDGATMARWAARLPHSDGKVGLFGESYMGINQFLTVAAAGRNSPIRAMFPIISGHDLYSDTVTQGGLIDLEFSAFYLALVAGLNAGNPILEPLAELGATHNPSTLATGLANAGPVEADHSKALASYDLATVASVETGGSQAYDGPYWAARSPATYLSDVVADHIPAFLVGGWNDLFQEGEPLNYVALQNLYAGRPASSPMTARQQATPRYQLMMGPWMHVTTGTRVNMAAIEAEWFDTWLLGQRTPLSTTNTPLHLFQLHSGKWFNTSSWPVAGGQASTYFFGPGRSGSDQLSVNDGTLTTAAPRAAAGADTALWSPASSPCDVQSDQWSGGFIALVTQQMHTTDPCDNNDETLGTGPDAVTFTSAPFRSARALAGPIDATIYATSTTTDAELAATIEEVSPSGTSVPLTSGALLGSLRKLSPAGTWMGSDGRYLLPAHPFTASSASPVVPGRVTRYDISVFPTFALIPSGWRLRVTITTADTPHLGVSAVQLPHLLGGVYEIQRHAGAASYINVPLVSPATFTTPCGALCSTAGP